MRKYIIAFVLMLLPTGVQAQDIERELYELATNIAGAFSPNISHRERKVAVRAILADLPFELLARLAFAHTLKQQRECVQKNPELAVKQYVMSDKVVDFFADEPVDEYAMKSPIQLSNGSWAVTTIITMIDQIGERRVLKRHRYVWSITRVDGVLKIVNLATRGLNLREYLTQHVRSNKLPCPDMK